MKKVILSLFVMLMFATSAYSVTVVSEESYTMENFWEKNGKYEEKMFNVGSKILYANSIDKRVPFRFERNQKVVNASATLSTKVVTIYQGILPYVESDDEFAYVLSHEIAHSLDAYGGFLKWTAMKFNSKNYEYKADLIAIDLMTKAGYNPIAAIVAMNKIFPESFWDSGISVSHPKGSKRMLAVYKYISKKYPEYLKSNYTKNIQYQNFIRVANRDIREFEQKEREKALRLEQKRLKKETKQNKA